MTIQIKHRDKLGVGTVFVKIHGVKLFGVYDQVNANALRFKEIDSAVTINPSPDDLFAEPSIDLVYIATPPYLHYPQSRIALFAGKHVICEKPAALHTEHAEELREMANQQQLLYVVNLMQRYNPLY